MRIATEDVGGGQQIAYRTFIKFDAFFDRSNSCSIRNAYLNLNFTGNAVDSHKATGGANDFIISRVIENWGEDTLRWETPPTLAPYRMPLVTNIDRVSVTGTSNGDENYRVNITDLVRFWRDNPDSNFGIEIRLETEALGRSLTFASEEFPSPSIRPSVDITFRDCASRRANAGQDVEICQGQSVELDGKYGEFFKWDNDPTLSNLFINNPIASPSTTTSYYLETTLGDCSSRDTVTVTVYDYPTLNVGSDEEICFGDTVQLSATTDAVNIEWTPNSNIINNTSLTPDVYPTSTTAFTATVDNDNKCTVSKDVRVVVRPLPNTDAGDDVTICEGESIDLFARGADSYQWDNAPGLVGLNSPTPTASPTDTTTYVVTGTRGICSTRDDVVVNVTPKPVVNVGPDQEVCEGDTAYMTATPGFNIYEWGSTDPLQPVSFNNDKIRDPFISNVTENLSLKLVVYDAYNCTAEDFVDVVVNDNPRLDAGIDTFICFGEEIDLEPLVVQGQGAIQYRWTNTLGMAPEDATEREPTVKAITTGVFDYELIVTDENGCSSSDIVRVTMLEKPEFEIEALKDTACENTPVSLIGKGAISYEWFPAEYIAGSNLSNRVTVIPPVEPQQFRFYGKTFERCGSDTSDAVSINVIELPRPRIGIITNVEPKYPSDTMICKGDEVTLIAEGAEEYRWLELEDTAQEVSFRVLTDSQMYTLVGFDQGCRGYTDSVVIRQDTAFICQSTIYAPNVFRPIGAENAVNREFKVQGEKIRNYQIQIFDRWGVKMFESTSMDDSWDGYFQDVLVPQGVYYYIINAFGEDEEVRNLNGTVTVIY